MKLLKDPASRVASDGSANASGALTRLLGDSGSVVAMFILKKVNITSSRTAELRAPMSVEADPFKHVLVRYYGIFQVEGCFPNSETILFSLVLALMEVKPCFIYSLNNELNNQCIQLLVRQGLRKRCWRD